MCCKLKVKDSRSIVWQSLFAWCRTYCTLFTLRVGRFDSSMLNSLCMKFQVDLEIFKITLKFVFCVKHFHLVRTREVENSVIN